MTPAELKARIEAARGFETEADGIVFECVVPSKLEMRSGFRARAARGDLGFDAFLSDLLARNVRGWRGVMQGHLVADLDAADAAVPVPFEPGLLPALFGGRPELYDTVAQALIGEYSKRQAAQEETLKN